MTALYILKLVQNSAFESAIKYFSAIKISPLIPQIRFSKHNQGNAKIIETFSDHTKEVIISTGTDESNIIKSNYGGGK